MECQGDGRCWDCWEVLGCRKGLLGYIERYRWGMAEVEIVVEGDVAMKLILDWRRDGQRWRMDNDLATRNTSSKLFNVRCVSCPRDHHPFYSVFLICIVARFCLLYSSSRFWNIIVSSAHSGGLLSEPPTGGEILTLLLEEKSLGRMKFLSPTFWRKQLCQSSQVIPGLIRARG